MKDLTLRAETRSPGNRGSVRRLRRVENRIPAVLYGGDEAPIPLSLPGDSVNRHALDEAFYTHILKLIVGEQEHSVVVRDVQRHPYKRRVIHLDFLRVLADRQLTMHVPVHILNEQTSAGVRAGGIVNHLLNEIEVRCLPKDIPEAVEVDIARLEVDQTLHLSEIRLPSGVELVHAISADHDPGVVAIHKPRTEAVAEPGEEQPAESEAEAPAASSAE